MKRTSMATIGLLALSGGAFAQSGDDAAIQKALMPAPKQMQAAATVVKWKPDFTYDTLRKGTNKLVCYERSGFPGKQAFDAECTSIANLDRVAQNLKFEAIADKAAQKAAFDKAEMDGSRVKPEFGSVWYHLSGADTEHTRAHITIAVPMATAASMGLPDNPQKGGVYIMNAGTTTAHIMTPGS